ncbi:cell cycle checkpoint protein RAD1-like isoform X2 [Anthonomus grandis grandis]|uniref:cell cycle checkpoint protein RAD1-like isoform X2 n=1 Tax=Anthonomus grandis grandis TaxID=2921223 RepID=UPI0021650DED|nr:cell cycle checkpoint protein RAD1-like isoform X2 [Anthonomus grandis grandis]
MVQQDVNSACDVMNNTFARAVPFKFAILQPMEEGLKVTIDEKCIETSAYIPSNMFLSYHIADDDNIMFRINLKTLTDILNIFGDDSNASLKLTFRCIGDPLCVVMTHTEENITVDCEIKTMNLDDFDNPSLSEECNLNKIVVTGSIFYELLLRLDNSAEDLKIMFSPDFPYFNLKSTSLSGESEVSLNKNSECVHSYLCKEKTDFTYAFSNIRHIIKVLNYASRVAISTGNSGLLGLQLIITSDDNQMYVEYYVTAQYMRDD